MRHGSDMHGTTAGRMGLNVEYDYLYQVLYPSH
jgi:hypothetical protein